MPNARTLLALWDEAEREHPIDVALSMLTAFTGEPRGKLASLPIHRRDALLLASRIAAFGNVLEGVATCQACGGKIDASLNLASPPAISAEEGGPGTADVDPGTADVSSVEVCGRMVSFRVPNSLDLAEAARASGPSEAEKILLARCQLSGVADDAAALAINEEIERLCDSASLELQMDCPHCQRDVVVPVDIALFFWQELVSLAASLIDEVDALALRYGWAEADILAMPERRRRRYLERCQ
jgi:hypothetical protein